MFVTSSWTTLKIQTQILYEGALLLQNDPHFWVSFPVGSPLSSCPLLWHSSCVLPTMGPEVASLRPFGKAPSLTTLRWCGRGAAGGSCCGSTFQKGWGWLWVPAPLWKPWDFPISSGKNPLVLPLGGWLAQVSAVWTGCGRCPGPGAAAALDADLPSVLGVCVTPTPGLHYSRWPWAQGNRADFWDVAGCDIPCSVHPSTNTGPRACLKSSIDRTTFLPPLLSWVYFLCFYEAIQWGFQRDKSKCNINV